MKSARISQEKKKRYKAWLGQSMYDLRAAKLSYGNAFYEWACFQSEQSAEKALKAVLVHAGWRPPKMHKLSILVSYCNHANAKFNRSKVNFRDLESFTFISRYPFLVPGNNKAPHDFIQDIDANNCITQASGILGTVYEVLLGKTITYSEDEIRLVQTVTQEELNKRLQSSIDKLKNAFENLHKVYLFGSYARGENKPGSTVDLMIIADTKLRFIDRIKLAIETLSNGFPPIEPLVYTPEEFAVLSKSEGFFETAMDEAKLIYENKSKIKNGN